jgi:DNA transformation protein
MLKGGGFHRGELEAAGCTRWTYTREYAQGGKPTAMPYWTMPEGAEDDPDLACDWARRALAISDPAAA